MPEASSKGLSISLFFRSLDESIDGLENSLLLHRRQQFNFFDATQDTYALLVSICPEAR